MCIPTKIVDGQCAIRQRSHFDRYADKKETGIVGGSDYCQMSVTANRCTLALTSEAVSSETAAPILRDALVADISLMTMLIEDRGRQNARRS
jgi:hypothetical protein